MLLLELLNTLAVLFVATEVGIRNQPWKAHVNVGGGLLLANVMLSSRFLEGLTSWSSGLGNFLTFLKTAFVNTLFVLEYPFLLFFKYTFGSSLTVAFAAALITFAVERFILNGGRDERFGEDGGAFQKLKGFVRPVLVGLAMFTIMYSHEHDGDAYISYVFTVFMVAVFFSLAAFLDVRREVNTLTFLGFMPHVIRGLKWVLPVFPFLMVAFSLFFFLLVCLCEAVKIDPHFLNYPIYYGTLYGPFSLVYWNVKKEMLKSTGGLVATNNLAQKSRLVS